MFVGYVQLFYRLTMDVESCILILNLRQPQYIGPSSLLTARPDTLSLSPVGSWIEGLNTTMKRGHRNAGSAYQTTARNVNNKNNTPRY